MTAKHRENYEKLKLLIAKQQEGHENEPVFMVGEQLKEIAEREEGSCELLLSDLAVAEMSLACAEKEIKSYSDMHRGSARAFCVSPMVAEGILRKFYGLAERAEKENTEREVTGEGEINLADFFV